MPRLGEAYFVPLCAAYWRSGLQRWEKQNFESGSAGYRWSVNSKGGHSEESGPERFEQSLTEGF